MPKTEEPPKPLQNPDEDPGERGDYIGDDSDAVDAIWAEADAVRQCADPECEGPSVDGEFCEEHRG